MSTVELERKLIKLRNILFDVDLSMPYYDEGFKIPANRAAAIDCDGCQQTCDVVGAVPSNQLSSYVEEAIRILPVLRSSTCLIRLK